MSLSLSSQIVADSTAVFLQTSDFAETVTYYPKDGGTPKSFPAVVEERIEPRQDEHGIFDVPVLVAEIAMDPAGKQGLAGRPKRGDALWRSGFGDDASVKWFFAGRVLGADGNVWELEFERIEQVQAGTVKSV